MAILAVVLMRVGGVHLHLCFDGQEAPAELHVAEGPLHDVSHHLEETHSDKDVQIADDALVKKEAGVDLPLLLAVCLVLLLLLTPDNHWRRATIDLVFPREPWRLRPPLRGPPL